MDFTVFDTSKAEEYAAKAKASWGNTPEYHEFEKKAKGRSQEEEMTLNVQMMAIFTEFGRMKEQEPSAREVQMQVKKLQKFITDNFYTCSNDTLAGLGKMYADGSDFTANIDEAGGKGTAEFVNQAIQIYCSQSI